MATVFRYLVTIFLILQLNATTSLAQQPGQNSAQNGLSERLRSQEVNSQLRALRSLLSEVGAGHPKVQDQIRRLRLLEDDMKFDLSVTDRVAAKLQIQEVALEEHRQKALVSLNERAKPPATTWTDVPPDLDTIQRLRSDCLSELQRIEWDETYEKALASSQSKAIESTANPKTASEMASSLLEALTARRHSVEKRLQSLQQSQKVAEEIAPDRQKLLLMEQQIHDLQMQRFHVQARKVEIQTLLELINEATVTVQTRDRKIN
jgi:hypothetical protein